uniref:Uncharacterized protein n=1 Tax=Plectus sambesii TaxID=2011161 RepID=A0A914W5V4_9BILA
MAIFSSICDTPLWNYTDSINASFVVFSPCFQNTICPLIPSIFLACLTPFLVGHCVISREPPLKWTKRLKYKVFLTTTAFVLSFAYAFLAFDGWLPDAISYTLSALLTFFTMAMILLMTLLCQYNGIVSTGVLHLTWLLVVISDIPQLLWWNEQFNEQDDLSQVSHGWPRFLLFIVRFILEVQLTILHCFADVHNDYSSLSANDKMLPELKASFLNRITYWWAAELPAKGYKKPLTMDDLWDLNTRDRSHQLYESWCKLWNPIFADYQRKESKRESEDQRDEKQPSNMPPLFRLLVRLTWRTIAVGFVLVLPMQFFNFSKPYLLRILIDFLDHQDQPLWKGVFVAFLMFAASSVESLITNRYYHEFCRGGFNVKSILYPAIFSKALRLSNASRKLKTSGEIVNLISVDTNRVEELWNNGIFLIVAPVKIIIATAMIYQMLGAAATFAGIGILSLLIPMTIVIVRWQKKLSTQGMKSKDERLKLMNEILNGIKVLKLYAWEPSMEKLVSDIRRKEMNQQKHLVYTRVIEDTAFFSIPFIATMAAFATYVLLDPVEHALTPSKAFVSVTLFNWIRWPLMSMPNLVVQVVKANVSFKRIVEFLVSEELDPDAVEMSHNENAIELCDCTLMWSHPEAEEEEQSDSGCLKNLTLNVRRGELIAVVGKVGAGKSNLLSAIMGEMYKTSGRIIVGGSLCYAPQQAWIQNMSLRDNVLFGSPFNQERYDSVIEACALLPDLAVLPAGDSTEIGEKGINLSGGQKARVSLARAVYQNHDIYLLDDPISAVDSHVARHLFDKVIGPSGILRDKTRILVTHSLAYLKHVDKIVVMQDGCISELGSYDQLIANNGAFGELLKEFLTELAERQKSERSLIDYDDKCNDDILDVLNDLALNDPSVLSSPLIARQTSRQSTGHNIVPSFPELKPDNSKANDRSSSGMLIEDEEVETGTVAWTVYGMYVRAAGLITIAVNMACLILGHGGFEIGGSFWLADWSEDADAQTRNATVPFSIQQRIGIYGAFGMGQALFFGASTLCVAIGSYRASRKLHDALVHTVMRSPMSFFDTTPLGRIINRFSKDMENVDDHLPYDMQRSISLLNDMFISLLIISISTPALIIGVILVAALYMIIYRYYMRVSRQANRLQHTTFSFICSHLQDSVVGAASIRAFRAQHRFYEKMTQLTDRNVCVEYNGLLCNRWMEVRTELVSNLLILGTALAAVYLGRFGAISAGLLGLSISYALNISDYLFELYWNMCEVETNIVSIERIKDYISNTTEAEWECPPEKKPPSAWPTHGSIKFNGYSLRY